MDKKDFSKMTDTELQAEQKKVKRSKTYYALAIGFLAAIVIFGMASWILSEKKGVGFFIPMLFPIIMIYKLLKKKKTPNDLEQVLKERKLH